MEAFASFVGDRNPIHHDEAVAKAAGFRAPIAYGMVAGSMFSEILGNELPGPGAVYASQDFKFLSPIYVGDEVELRVEVVEVRADQRVVRVRTTCHDQDGVLCIDGHAVLIRRPVGEAK
jgi:3-hydroxybutyryl-CoA dehydratase